MFAVPHASDVFQIAATRLNGRTQLNSIVRTPGKQVGGPVDERVAKPTLGGRDASTRHLNAPLPGKDTDNA